MENSWNLILEEFKNEKKKLSIEYEDDSKLYAMDTLSDIEITHIVEKKTKKNEIEKLGKKSKFEKPRTPDPDECCGTG